jgi:hypothetical protein
MYALEIFRTSVGFLRLYYQENVYFRVNFDKFSIHIRNKVRIVLCTVVGWAFTRPHGCSSSRQQLGNGLMTALRQLCKPY